MLNKELLKANKELRNLLLAIVIEQGGKLSVSSAALAEAEAIDESVLEVRHFFDKTEYIFEK